MAIPKMIQRDRAYTKHELADALDISVKSVERHWLPYGAKFGDSWLVSGRIIIRAIENRCHEEIDTQEES